jgi:hypothetical protein
MIAKIMMKNQSISELIRSPQYLLSIVPKIGIKIPPIHPISDKINEVFPIIVCIY